MESDAALVGAAVIIELNAISARDERAAIVHLQAQPEFDRTVGLRQPARDIGMRIPLFQVQQARITAKMVLGQIERSQSRHKILPTGSIGGYSAILGIPKAMSAPPNKQNSTPFLDWL
jgi:hypothetical protein